MTYEEYKKQYKNSNNTAAKESGGKTMSYAEYQRTYKADTASAAISKFNSDYESYVNNAKSIGTTWRSDDDMKQFVADMSAKNTDLYSQLHRIRNFIDDDTYKSLSEALDVDFTDAYLSAKEYNRQFVNETAYNAEKAYQNKYGSYDYSALKKALESNPDDAEWIKSRMRSVGTAEQLTADKNLFVLEYVPLSDEEKTNYQKLSNGRYSAKGNKAKASLAAYMALKQDEEQKAKYEEDNAAFEALLKQKKTASTTASTAKVSDDALKKALDDAQLKINNAKSEEERRTALAEKEEAEQAYNQRVNENAYQSEYAHLSLEEIAKKVDELNQKIAYAYENSTSATRDGYLGFLKQKENGVYSEEKLNKILNNGGLSALYVEAARAGYDDFYSYVEQQLDSEFNNAKYAYNRKLTEEYAFDHLDQLKAQIEVAEGDTKKELQQQYDELYHTVYGEKDWANYIVSNVGSGLSQWGSDMASGLDFILSLPNKISGGNLYMNNSPTQLLKESAANNYQNAQEKAAAATQAMGESGGWKIGANVISGVSAAIPDLVIAYLTAGSGTAASAAGKAASAGSKASKIFSTVKTAVKTTAKNPQFWTSFVREVGTTYDTALSSGATSNQATTTAIISSLINAYIEVGGGIETLPDALKNTDKSGVRVWVEQMFDEGKEEVLQGIVSNLTQKVVYDHDKQLVSSTDDDAVISLTRAANEFMMGALVGGILSAGPTAARGITSSYDQRVLDREGRKIIKNIQSDELYSIALQMPEGSVSRTYAEQNSEVLQSNTNKKTAAKTAQLRKYVVNDFLEQINVTRTETIDAIEKRYMLLAGKTKATAETRKDAEVIYKAYENIEMTSEENSRLLTAKNYGQILKELYLAAENDISPENEWASNIAITDVDEKYAQLEKVIDMVRVAKGEEVSQTESSAENTTQKTQPIEPVDMTPNVVPSADTVDASPFTEPDLNEGDFHQQMLAEADGKPVSIQARNEVTSIAKKLGFKVIWKADINTNGYIKGNTIVLNSRQTKPVLTVLVHEFVHSLEATGKYQEFFNLVWNSAAFKKWAENKTAVKLSVDELLERYKEKYKKVYDGSVLEQKSQKEMLCDFIADKLFRKNIADSEIDPAMLEAMKNHTFIDTILSWIRRIIAKFQKADSDVEKQIRIELIKIQDAIEKMYKQSQKQGFADDEVKYSIEYTTDNKPVVIVEDNILVGAPKSEWVKTVKKVIADKFSSGLPISGRLVKVNKITREEYTSSKYSKFLRDNDGNIYIDKFKSANNLDEIILATTNYINEDLNHKRKDSIKEFARGDVLISVGNNDYSAKVIVGFTGQNMVLYDVVDFTPANFDIKKKPPHTVKQSKTIRSGEASSNNILQKNEVVNSSISEKSQTEAGLDNDEEYQNMLVESSKSKDTDYLKAVEQGDMETAQRMVDEAAKKAGYTVKAYHGTLTKGITEFKKEFIGSRFSYDEVGFFFTDNLSIAEDYATSEFNADRKGEVISAYLKTSNAFVFDKNYALKNGYGNVFRDNDNINVWDIYQTALLEEAEEHNADSIIIKDGQSMMIVVFDPNQIKSADPVTYDDDGNVIPLSKRFKENQDDIRYSLDIDTSKMTASEFVKSLGEKYHAKFDANEVSELAVKAAREVRRNGASEKGIKAIAKIADTIFETGYFEESTEGENVKTSLADELRSRDKYVSEKQRLINEMYDAFLEVSPESRREILKKVKSGTIGIAEADNRLAMITGDTEKVINAALKDAIEQRDRANEKAAKTKSDVRVEFEQRDIKRRAVENVRRRVNSLYSKLTQNMPNKHIPEELKPVVEYVINLISKADMNSFDVKRRSDVLRKYGKQQLPQISQLVSKSEFLDDKDVAELQLTLENMYDCLTGITEEDGGSETYYRSLRDLDYVTAKVISDSIETITHVVNNYDKVFLKDQQVEIDAFAQELINGLNGKRRKDFDNELALWAQNRNEDLYYGNMKPIYFFEKLGPAGMKLFWSLHYGQSKSVRALETCRRKILKAREKYGYDENWVDNTRAIEFTTKNGVELKMSADTAMSIYATHKRERILKTEHLTTGGIVIDSVTKKGTVKHRQKVELTFEDVQGIIKLLTKEQKAYADAMVKILSNDLAAYGNETTMQLYGIERFKDKYYFPFRVADSAVDSQPGISVDERISHRSWMNNVVSKANAPIRITSFEGTVAKHMNEMATFHGMAVPLKSLNRVLNFRQNIERADGTHKQISTKLSIETAYGERATAYLEQLIKDLNGGITTDNAEGMYKSLLSKFKKSAVLASASVVIQQPSAMIRAMAIVDPKYFVETTLSQRDYEELKRYSATAVLKEIGRFDPSAGQSMESYLLSKEYSGIKSKTKAMFKDGQYRDDVLGWAAGKADEITWAHIWNAVKRETLDSGKYTNGTEEFFKAAAERFDEVIEYTQVYDSQLTKSELMRSQSAIAQTITAFMAEPTTSLNMLLHAIGSKDTKKIGRWLAAWVGSVAVNSLLKSIITAMRDDDDDKTYLEKYLGELVGNFVDDINPLSMIPIVKDAVSIIQGYSVKRSDMQLVEKFVAAGKGLISAGTNEDRISALTDVAISLGDIFGVPANNIKRELTAVYNTVTSPFIKGTTGTGISRSVSAGLNESFLGVFGVGEKATSKNDYKNLYKAIRDGDETAQLSIENILLKAGKDIDSGLATALKENDKRISQAAQADIDGDSITYDAITTELLLEGFDANVIASAISSARSDIENPVLNEKEKTEIAQRKSNYAAEYMNNYNSEYETMLDDFDIQSDVVTNIHKYAKAKAEYEILGKKMSNTYANAKAYEDAGFDIVEYFTAKALISSKNTSADSDNNGTLTKEEKEQAILESELKNKDFYYAWEFWQGKKQFTQLETIEEKIEFVKKNS